MKKMIGFATPLMAAVLMTGATVATHAQSAAQNTQEPAAMQAGNPESQQANQAYEDGKMAAKLDTVAKRPIDAKTSHLYKKPPVKGAAQAEYRTSFEKGYNDALKSGGL